MDRMPTEPDKHDLLGFPGIQAEHPKCYIRRLWLVAENDRISFPQFLDKDVRELAGHVNSVINTFLKKNEEMRHEELCADAFLETDAVHILKELGFGQRIWGEGSGAETRLKSNLHGRRPRWGVETDSGYEHNDEDSIQLNLRCWMAARIQAKTNAPCKEKKRVPLVTVDHTRHLSLGPVSQPCPQRPQLSQQGGSSDTSGLVSSCLEHCRNLSIPTVEAEQEEGSRQSRSRARSYGSNDSDSSLDLRDFMHTDPVADFPRSRNHGSKRPRVDILTKHGLHTWSPQQNPVATTADMNVPSDMSTNITIPDVCNNNHKSKIEVDEGSHSSADQIKQKLQRDLTRFLNDELDYAGILREVIPPTRQLYASSPYRKPYSDLEVEFRNFNRALDHWETLIKRLTTSARVSHSFVKDPLQNLAAQRTFEDRVAMLHNFGPRSHTDFPLEGLTISLALFFEGLLGATYMPFPFEDLVRRLRIANQPLYDTIAVGSDQPSGGKDI